MTSNDKEERDGKGRFVKGNDAGFSSRPEDINREGRPLRPSLTAALLRKLNAEGTESQASGKKIADALVDATLKEALHGSFPHLKEIWNRLDGKDTGAGDLLVAEDAVGGLKSRDDLHKAAIRLYCGIIKSPTASARDRIVAQAELNKLLGLSEEEATPQEHAREIQKALTDMLNATLQEEEPDTTESDNQGSDDDKAGE